MTHVITTSTHRFRILGWLPAIALGLLMAGFVPGPAEAGSAKAGITPLVWNPDIYQEAKFTETGSRFGYGFRSGGFRSFGKFGGHRYGKFGGRGFSKFRGHHFGKFGGRGFSKFRGHRYGGFRSRGFHRFH